MKTPEDKHEAQDIKVKPGQNGRKEIHSEQHQRGAHELSYVTEVIQWGHQGFQVDSVQGRVEEAQRHTSGVVTRVREHMSYTPKAVGSAVEKLREHQSSLVHAPEF